MRSTISIALLVGLTCTAVVGPSNSALAATQLTATRAEPQAEDRLEVGVPVKRPIRAGESHSFVVRLKAGDFADLLVEQSGSDVAVTVLDPSGAKILTVDSPNSVYGPEPAALVADATGDFRILLGAPDRGGGSYEVRLLALRAATDVDRRWVAAVEALSAASNLVVARSTAAAVEKAESALEIARSCRGADAPELVAFLEVAGRAYGGARQLDKAVALLGQGLAIAEKAYGAADPRLACTLMALGSTLTSQLKHAEAQSAFVRAVSVLEQVHGVDSPAVGDAVAALAGSLANQGRLADATPNFVRSLAVAEKQFGPDHQEVATRCEDLALNYQKRGMRDEAESLFLRAIAIRDRQVNENTRFATLVHRYGVLLLQRGQYVKAEPVFRRALAMREKLLPPDNVYIGQTSDELGDVHYNIGNFAEAEKLIGRALAIREKAHGAEHPDVAQTLMHLGLVVQAMGQYSRAEPLLSRALAIREKLFGPDDGAVADSLSGLAVLYHYRGENIRAIPIFERCIAINEKARGPESTAVGVQLNNLGAAYRELGEFRKADEAFRRALPIVEKALGANHSTVGIMLSNIGALQIRMQKPAEAEATFKRMIAILEQSVGTNGYYLSLGLQNLAETYRLQGRLDMARPLLERAVAIQEASEGNRSGFSGVALISLSSIYRESGDVRGAILASSKSNEGLEKAFGPVHPWVASSLASLAFAQAADGNMRKALEYLSRANEARDRVISHNLSSGSERAKRDYMKYASNEFESTMSLQALNAPADPVALRLAVQTLLRRKAIALDVMTDAIENLRRNAVPEDAALLGDLQDARAQLASLSVRGPGAESVDAYKARVQALSDRVDALESDVSRRSTRYRVSSEPVTIDAVRNAIPTGAVLVEFASFRAFNPHGGENTSFGKRRYAAYVLSGGEETRWVDLGDAEPVDALVERMRQSLADPKRKDTRALSRELDRLLMEPVRKLCSSSRRLLLSPDGPLTLVPFAALVDERGRYLVESYTISYLTSGRDLLRTPSRDGVPGRPTILANPKFGDASDVATATGTRDIVQAGSLVFSPLPGTMEEARELATILPDSVVLSDANATETAVKQVHGPRVLHIATHGFFLDRDPDEEIETNPLVRSGLALAGANARISGAEDGVLTALEVAGLDLAGTELVVLSACNTGVGDALSGEGVSGLRRALVLAGSESQVISLWPIADRATRDLMVAYYRRLLAGDGRTEALRQVQLRMLRSRSTRHPFYWAGFIQSGAWTSLDGFATAGQPVVR